MKKQKFFIFHFALFVFVLSLPALALTLTEKIYIQKFLSSTPKEQLESIQVLKPAFPPVEDNKVLVLENLLLQNLTFNVQIAILNLISKKNITYPGVQNSMIHLLDSSRTLLKIKNYILYILNMQGLSPGVWQSLAVVVLNGANPISIRKNALSLLGQNPPPSSQFSHILMRVISEPVHKLSGPYTNSPFFLKAEASKLLHHIKDPSLFASFIKAAFNTPNNLVKDTTLNSLYHLPVSLQGYYEDPKIQTIIASTILKETNTKIYSQLLSVLVKAKKLHPFAEKTLAKILTDKDSPAYAKKEGLKGFAHLPLPLQVAAVTYILLQESNKSLHAKLFKVLNQIPPAPGSVYGSPALQKVMNDIVFHSIHAASLKVKGLLFLLKAVQLNKDFITPEFEARVAKLTDISSYTNPYLTETATLFVPHFKDFLLQKKVVLSTLKHKNSYVMQAILKVLYHRRASINPRMYEDTDIQKQLVTMVFFPQSHFEQDRVFEVLRLASSSVDPEVKAVLTKAAQSPKNPHRQQLARVVLNHLRVFAPQAGGACESLFH